MKDALFVGLLVKLFIFLLGYFVTCMHEGGLSPLSIGLRQFSRWDGPQYLAIARNWYGGIGEQRLLLAFFPLYPALIRLTTFNYGCMELSALIISNISSLVAFVYLFKLVEVDFDDDVSFKSVLYLAIYPTVYFLCGIYTESLFLALVLTSFYCARLQKWFFAGLLGMFASLTRIYGLILVPSLLVEYFSQRKWRLRKIGINVGWLSLVLIGFSIYLFINYSATGDFLAFIEVQRTHWTQEIDPLLGLQRAWWFACFFAPPPYRNITVGSAQLFFAVLGLLATIGSFLRLRSSYGTYMLFAWMLSVCTSMWISIPRFTLVMFPLFILLGLIGKRKVLNYVAIPLSLLWLFFFSTLFFLGQWAF